MLKKLLPISIFTLICGISIPFICSWGNSEIKTSLLIIGLIIGFIISIFLYKKNPVYLLFVIFPVIIFGQIFTFKIREWYYEISLSEILIILLTIFVIFDYGFYHKFKKIKLPLLMLILIFYLSLAVISVGWSESVSRSFIALKNMGFHLLALALTLNLINSRRDLKQALFSLPLVGLLTSGQLIYLVFKMGGLFSLQPIAREAIITPVGKWVYVAAIIILTIPLTYSLLLQTKKKFLKWSLGLIILIGLIACALTLGKGEIIAVLVGFGYFIVRQKSQRKIGLAIIAAFVIITMIPLASYGQKFIDRVFSTFQDPNTNFRVTEFKIGLKLFSEKPLLGLGIGNLKLAYKNHLPWSVESESNNLILQIVLELGLFGLGIALLIAREVFRIFKTLGQRINNHSDYILYLGFISTLIVAIINAFVEVTIIGLYYGIIFWSIIGLGIVFSGLTKKNEL